MTTFDPSKRTTRTKTFLNIEDDDEDISPFGIDFNLWKVLERQTQTSKKRTDIKENKLFRIKLKKKTKAKNKSNLLALFDDD